MKTTDRIKELQDEINRCKQSIKDCKHSWDKTIYDPEITKEPVFSHFEPHGSDPEPIYNWHDKTISRWSRTCVLCGYTEYTKEQGPIEPVKIGPKFSKK